MFFLSYNWLRYSIDLDGVRRSDVVPLNGTRLAASGANDGTQIYLYRQLNAFTMVEGTYGAHSHGWTSSNFTIEIG